MAGRQTDRKKLKLASYVISNVRLYSKLHVFIEPSFYLIQNVIKYTKGTSKPRDTPACRFILLFVDENPPDVILCCIFVKLYSIQHSM